MLGTFQVCNRCVYLIGGLVKKMLALIGISACALSAAALHADSIAYDNQAAGQTNQNYGNSLGLDFNVNTPITVTELGAYDSGLTAQLAGVHGSSGVTVAVYDRRTGTQVGPSVTFTPSNVGTQINADAFLPIAPLSLPAGFQGSIVAFNDPNYNSEGVINSTSIQNDGGGDISFVGGGRYGGASGFPGTVDGGPTNRYDAGTFIFQSAVPEPASIGLITFAGIGLLARHRRR